MEDDKLVRYFLVKGIFWYSFIVFRSKKFGSREKNRGTNKINRRKIDRLSKTKVFKDGERQQRFSKRVLRPVKEIWQASRIVSNV